MCTSIIFLHSIRFLNLEQLGCVSSLWKTVLKRLCLVTVEVVFFFFSLSFQLFMQVLCALFWLGLAQSRGKKNGFLLQLIC